MNARSLKGLLCESPHPTLLDAVDDGQNHRALLPLLEAELERSSSRLQRLKEYRNSLTSPFYNLLPEILSHIFFIYAQDNDELFSLRWARLLLVCRRWHEVGLTTPKLWSFVTIVPSYTEDPVKDGLETKRIQAQLSRSGMWPVTITLNPDMGVLNMKWSTIIPWDRLYIRSLVVSGSNSPIFDDIIHALDSRSHSMLVELTLHRSIFPGEQSRSQSVPDNLLKNGAPQLRYMTVTGLSMNLKLLHGLRKLYIGRYPIEHLPELPKDILGVLSRCPELEEFYLFLQENVAQIDDTLHESPVFLPRLRVLSIQASVPFCAALLNTLSNVPSTAKICLSALGVQPNLNSSVASLITHLAIHSQQEQSPAIRALSLAYAPDFTSHPPPLRLEFTGQLYPEQHRTYDHDFGASMYIRFVAMSAVEFDIRSLENITMHVMGAWTLSRVTHLDARSIGRWPVTIPWLALFEGLSAVTTVVVCIDLESTHALLEHLSTQLRGHDRRVIANIIFDARDVEEGLLHPHMEFDESITNETFSRCILMRTMDYCREAARVGVALDTVEIMNGLNSSFDPPSVPLVHKIDSVDWSELYTHLNEGFIYEGVLYNHNVGNEGIKRDSFGAGI